MSNDGDMALREEAEPSPRPAADLAKRLDRGLRCLPEAGAHFLGFQLISELGRGAFSRVFLARQASLGDRLVALKVAVDLFGEPQRLAQLQHTNIVPIYSAHHAEPLQALCMPYFGPSTLADLLRSIKNRSSLPRTGNYLVTLLRETQLNEAANERDVRSAQRLGDAESETPLQKLQGLSHVQVMLWLAARLAEGLEHAHERGILHRDLKPANVLLGNDGQPMLMDFNISEDVKLPPDRRGAQHPGGTIAYMAPEHLEAFRDGHGNVDARADVYSLGVMLHEMLTGCLPFPLEAGALAEVLPRQLIERRRLKPEPKRLNPALSPAVASIVCKCLAPNPADRYQSAGDLAEDLQRQLDHLPLKHAPEPSMWERVRKWSRRHPRLTSPASLAVSMALGVSLVLVPAAWLAWEHFHSAARQTEVERDEVRQIAKTAGLDREALSRFDQFQARLSTLGALEGQLILASLPETDRNNDVKLCRTATQACRELLDAYKVGKDPSWQQSAKRHLPADRAVQLSKDIGQILQALAQAQRMDIAALTQSCALARETQILLAALGLPAVLTDAGTACVQARARTALALNRLAESCYAPEDVPVSLQNQQAVLLAMLGKNTEADDLRFRAGKRTLHEARDFFWQAQELATRSRYQDALPFLETCIRLEPGRLNPWLLQAVCLQRLASFDGDRTKYSRAEASYDTCLALRPDDADVLCHRAQVCLAQGKWAKAAADSGRLLKERPGWRPALVLQALASAVKAEELASEPRAQVNPREKEQALKDAIDKLTALLKDDPAADVYYRRGMLRKNETNFAKRPKAIDETRADFRRALSATPAQAPDWLHRAFCRIELEALDVIDRNWDRPPEALQRLLADVPSAKVAEEALTDLDHALTSNPHDLRALDKKAELLARGAKLFEALHVLDRVVELNPDYLEARVRRAFLRARLGLDRLASQDAEELRNRDPSARQYDNAARIFAITSKVNPLDRPHAIKLLSYALRHGYGWDRFRTEPDLSALRQEAAFVELAKTAQRLGRGVPERMRFPSPVEPVRPAKEQ